MFAPVFLQRVEGLVLLVAGIVGFVSAEVSWWWFFGLLLVPDLSMAGYLVSPSAGARLYNAGHTIIAPGLLFGAAIVWEPVPVLVVAASVWLAHIGMDRLFGYGLKFGDDFQHTHLGWIGGGDRG
jgi:hypothetical protein